MKIQIELEINGNNKTFVAPYLKGKLYKDIFKMYDMLQETRDIKVVNELVSFVCDVFGNQFTIDEYYDGIPLSKCLTEIVRVLNELIQMVNEGIEQDTQR